MKMMNMNILKKEKEMMRIMLAMMMLTRVAGCW